MNEEEIIKRIEEATKDLPVPDSISPENMEKMLNEHIDNKEKSTADKKAGFNKSAHTNEKSSSGFKRNRLAIVLAACFGIIIIGSGVMGIINKDPVNKSSDTAATEAIVDTAYDDSDNEEALADEAAPDDNDTISSDPGKEDEELGEKLALAGDLHKAKSYEDYYNAIEAARVKFREKYEQEYAKDEMIVNEAADDSDYVKDSDLSAETNDYTVASNAAGSSDTSSRDFNSGATKSNSLNTGSGTGAKESSSDHSTTNTQEKEIDEADIVKTDGKFIYVAHRETYDIEPYISITKAEKDGKLKNIDSVTIPSDRNNPLSLQEFYIYNNYMIVMCTSDNLDYYYYNYENTSYDSDDYMKLNKSYIFIYDISNRKKASLVKTLSQTGYYNSSRISNGFLYTISSFNRYDYLYDSSRTKGYDKYIPYLNDDMIPYKNLYYSDYLENMSTYVITSVDLNDPVKYTDSKAVSSSNAEIYVGEESIYLYSNIYDRITKTEILKIGYKKGKLTVGNRGVVAGYLYGPFALSEYKGNLRIVSTIPANNFSWFSNDVLRGPENAKQSNTLNEDINALYILDQDMHILGKITGLAPGEQIYSARFMGDIGYFVTYRNTDPLFSVDLSNPRQPKILGALKIPGFSDYLHFYGNNTLLGIGEERTVTDSSFIALKLSMFDISDPSNVTENDKYILKNSYYSPAQYDYKSILIDPDKNIIGFYYEAEGDNYEYDPEYDSYYSDYGYYYSTFKFDKKKGFIETARYKLDNNYSYDFNSIRGLFIGDYFYLVTPQYIESYRIGDTKLIDRIG